MEMESSYNKTEMQQIVEDYWNLFSRDYDNNDETFYYQITCRILYEVNKWIERDSSLGPIVYSKLFDLNFQQNYDYKIKSHTLNMLNHTYSCEFQTNSIEERPQISDNSYKKALHYVISKLIQGNSEISFNISSYHTISLNYKDNHFEKVKVSISKDYCSQNNNLDEICCSQHRSSMPKFIEEYDYFIFINKEVYKALIFSNKQLIDHLRKKEYESKYFNFHFHWFMDGTIIDTMANQLVDVSEFDADNMKWKLPKRYLQK